MFYIYILENKDEKHYIGHTNNLGNRLHKHNVGQIRSTKNKGPWKIIYTENYATKQEAYKRELQIKSYKGGNALKNLLRRDGRVA